MNALSNVRQVMRRDRVFDFMLQKIGLKRFAGTLKQETDEKPLCILDYFNGNNQNMDKEILKYAFLEKSPRIFAKFWAHHQYLMFESR